MTAFEPVFLAGPAGRLYGIYHPPRPEADDGSAFVYVPPFAEEMNRSRRMASLQARALAQQGVGTLLLDLYGTGDSAGDFVDARWALWRDDVIAAAAWLREGRGRRSVGLWGLRLGALLAADVAVAEPGRFPHLLLWQPVTDGKAMLTQFLRIRLAAAMGGSEVRESTGELRAQLAAGRSLEVAGYAIASELAAAIDQARLEPCQPPPGTRVDWLEVAAAPDVATASGAAMVPGRQRIADRWREAGVTLSVEAVLGEPFWSLQEVTLAPNLLSATGRLLAPCPA